jgi:hypothetical protein
MIDLKEKDNKEPLSARSVIYGALFTFALIFVLFCVYTIAVVLKLVVVVLGPVIFSIVTTGVVLVVLLGVVQLVKAKRMKGKNEHDDA